MEEGRGEGEQVRAHVGREASSYLRSEVQEGASESAAFARASAPPARQPEIHEARLIAGIRCTVRRQREKDVVRAQIAVDDPQRAALVAGVVQLGEGRKGRQGGAVDAACVGGGEGEGKASEGGVGHVLHDEERSLTVGPRGLPARRASTGEGLEDLTFPVQSLHRFVLPCQPRRKPLAHESCTAAPHLADHGTGTLRQQRTVLEPRGRSHGSMLRKAMPRRAFVSPSVLSLLGLVAFLAVPACGGDGENKAKDKGGSGPAVVVDSATPEADGGALVETDDAGVPPATPRAVRVIVQPGDDGAALLAAIGGAKTSIHLTMYLLTSQEVTDALLARRRAGVEVKVILNKSFPQGGNANTTQYNRLRNGGVSVVWAPEGFRFTHSKCLILDERQVWIMTMNATPTSLRENREYLAVDDEAEDVAEAETIFQGDFTNRAVTVEGPLLVSPVNSKPRIRQLLDGATRTVELEAEALADTDVVASLVNAHQRGVAVQVVLSTDFTSDGEEQAIATLKGAGVPVRSLREPYVHAKALVVDGAQAYVGSINFTATSFTQNREVGVVIDAPAEVSKVQGTITADFKVANKL